MKLRQRSGLTVLGQLIPRNLREESSETFWPWTELSKKTARSFKAREVKLTIPSDHLLILNPSYAGSKQLHKATCKLLKEAKSNESEGQYLWH